MLVDRDISKILKSWEYEPDALVVRRIIGDDGKGKVQIRINLGILQMEVDGRPDGKTPYNVESLLDYYNSLIEDGTIEELTLTEQDMKDLDAEIMQYYHRRVCFFALRDFKLARRDAEHNLRLMDIIKSYCKDKDYIESHEQFKPFVIMERARAAGLESLTNGDYASAMQCVGDAIDMIEEFYRERGTDEEEIQRSRELTILKKWRGQIHQDWEGGIARAGEDDDENP